MNHQRGISLLEMLIAWSIVLVGLLGMSDLQTKNLHRLRDHLTSAIALTQIQSFSQRLQANPNFHSVITRWKTHTQQLLPNSSTQVNCQINQCELHLQWGHEKKQTFEETIYR